MQASHVYSPRNRIVCYIYKCVYKYKCNGAPLRRECVCIIAHDVNEYKESNPILSSLPRLTHHHMRIGQTHTKRKKLTAIICVLFSYTIMYIYIYDYVFICLCYCTQMAFFYATSNRAASFPRNQPCVTTTTTTSKFLPSTRSRNKSPPAVKDIAAHICS